MNVSSRFVNEEEGPLSSEKSDIDVYVEDSKDFADIDSSGDDLSDKDEPPLAPQEQVEERELPRH